MQGNPNHHCEEIRCNGSTCETTLLCHAICPRTNIHYCVTVCGAPKSGDLRSSLWVVDTRIWSLLELSLIGWIQICVCTESWLVKIELLCFVMCKHLIGWIQICVFTESWLVNTICYVLWCVSIWLVGFYCIFLVEVDWLVSIVLQAFDWSDWKLLINPVIWLVERYTVSTESLSSRQLLSGHWRVHM